MCPLTHWISHSNFNLCLFKRLGKSHLWAHRYGSAEGVIYIYFKVNPDNVVLFIVSELKSSTFELPWLADEIGVRVWVVRRNIDDLLKCRWAPPSSRLTLLCPRATIWGPRGRRAFQISIKIENEITSQFGQIRWISVQWSWEKETRIEGKMKRSILRRKL